MARTNVAGKTDARRATRAAVVGRDRDPAAQGVFRGRGRDRHQRAGASGSGVAKSTVHRLAVTLVAEGMLEQDRESGKYRLGIALFRLGALVRRRMDVSSEARPLSLRRCARRSTRPCISRSSTAPRSCTSTISKSTQAIRMRSDLGVRKPAYCTAEGQAILAFQPQDVVERVMRGGPHGAHAARPSPSPPKLLKALAARAPARLRHRGRGERDRHASAIAAPIRNDAGEVVAAVGHRRPGDAGCRRRRSRPSCRT